MIPIRNFNEVYHVGTLDIRDRGLYSLEGNTLSVSIHPDDWIDIARLGQTQLYMSACGIVRMLDALECLGNINFMDEVYKWGLDNHLIDENTVYDCWFTNEDEHRYFRFSSLEEMNKSIGKDNLIHLETHGFDEAHVRSLIESKLEEIENDGDAGEIYVSVSRKAYLFSKEIADKNRCSGITDNVPYALLAMYADVNLKEKHNLHGLWVNNIYDPCRLSCPAGGIFLSAIPSMNFTEVECAMEGEIPDIELIPTMKRKDVSPSPY